MPLTLSQKKRAVSKRYTANPEANLFLHRQWYSKHCSAVLQKQSRHYYASIKRRRAARLLRHAVNCSRDNAKNKLYHNQNKKRIVIAKKNAKRARYVLTEPKTDIKEKYVQNMKTRFIPNPLSSESYSMPSGAVVSLWLTKLSLASFVMLFLI